MGEYINVSEAGHIVELMINRPERKNALNLAMYQALADEIKAAPDRGARVILLYGAGDCFTSGNDLADFASGSDLSSEDNPIARFIFALLYCPIPVVVSVHGVAVGIGTTLLMHSDLVYADENARLRLPFVNLGLCPEFASSLVLPQLAGHVKAAEWLMLGDFFSANDALAVGLVNEVVDSPLAKARAQAERLAKQPPAALRQAKALMKAPGRSALEAVIHEEFKGFAEGLQGPEFAEAAAAFFEKRAPDFSSFK
ncbi:MAG: enoyl-CoA hydratase/isomerase family protein [Agarilytica sp.]